ncbi:MAG: NFACT RNA binding domain-containing protein [Candidatus Cloacimonadota bacterium]
MEYSYLKAWLKEKQPLGIGIERIEQSPELLAIRHKNGAVLTVLLSAREALLYWNRTAQIAEHRQIWTQLHHAELKSIALEDSDRIIRLDYLSEDIYGDKIHWQIVLELSTKHPNAILCKQDKESLVIVDALHKYSYADNPQRQVLPNLVYQAPQTSYEPRLFEVILPLEIKLPGASETIACNSLNSYFEAYHQRVLEQRKHLEEQASVTRFWDKEHKKVLRRKLQQEGDLEVARQGELWFRYAEAIKYELSNIKAGTTVVNACDYHDPELKKLEIPLFPEKSAVENMNFYLKKYHKAKSGLAVIEANLVKTDEELRRLELILERIRNGELIYPPGAGKVKKLSQKLAQAEKLLSVKLSADHEIFIGRKARENDFITTQLGRPTDWWFHTRIYHGSHVLLRCYTKKDPSPELVELCAALAAWYSKAKFSQNVPVDYTQIRFVRKPRKSAPGFVTYTNHKTIFADPIDLRELKAKLGL